MTLSQGLTILQYYIPKEYTFAYSKNEILTLDNSLIVILYNALFVWVLLYSFL
jgi:hypothetical protein